MFDLLSDFCLLLLS